MKKLLYMMLVGALALIASSSNAQTGSAYTFPRIAGDSLVNADTVFKVIPVTAGYASMGVQVAIKKGTGTLDGKAYLYTSVNGSNYLLTDSSSFTAVSAASPISNGGYTHSAIIQKTAPAGTSYLVSVTQAGSLTSSPVSVSYTARKN